MDKYKKYYGVFVLIAIIAIACYAAYSFIMPQYNKLSKLDNDIATQEKILSEKTQEKARVEEKLKKLMDSNQKTQKKIFSPVETDLGDDSLFFTLYNDVLDMIHSNSVKIKKMDYVYNPDDDAFVKHAKDVYFVCDINLELVSNYVNLGKLVQSLYQYPYYVKINSVDVKPYKKDKKILLTNMSLRLYAHTEPVVEEEVKPAETTKESAKKK